METDRLGSGEQDEVDLNDSGPSGIRMQPVPATAMPAEIRERRRPRRDNYQVSNLNHLRESSSLPDLAGTCALIHYNRLQIPKINLQSLRDISFRQVLAKLPFVF